MSARRAVRHWLVKTEPSTYSIDDLAAERRTAWEGVRNFQARNLLRDEMAVGDPVLVYHSSADPLAIVGLARVASEAAPDRTAFDVRSEYHDPKSRKDAPTWFVRELEHVETFAVPLERRTLLGVPALADMVLLQRGSRLSVQPVTKAEFETILALARAARRG